MTATKAKGRQRAGARVSREELPRTKAASETRSAKSALEAAPEMAAAALADEDGAGACGEDGAPDACDAGARSRPAAEVHAACAAAWAARSEATAAAGLAEPAGPSCAGAE